MPVNDEQTDDDFWDALEDHALDPVCVPMLEALRWIGEPLSAVALVDVLDGDLSMWEAAYYLRVLEALKVVEPSPGDTGSGTSGEDRFDLPYHLKDRKSPGDGR
jgi:hypothetical protein